LAKAHRWKKPAWLSKRTSCTECGLERRHSIKNGKNRYEYYRGGVPAGLRCGPCVKAERHPWSPFREALRVLCRGAEPPAFVKGDGTPGLTDQETDALQSWAASNASIDWMSGIQVIEAAESIVSTAYADGSLKDWRDQLAREVMET